MKLRDHKDIEKEAREDSGPEHGHSESGHHKGAPQPPHVGADGAIPDEHKRDGEKQHAQHTKPHAPQADGDRLKAAQAELAAVSDRMLRLQADYDNFRKRTLREKNDIYRRANEDIMLELLPVADHVELALATADADEAGSKRAAVVDGFRLVAEQLLSALKKFGLEFVEAAGQTFDASKHEAVSQMASESVPEGVVIHQIRRGYILADKLLRPAQVVVSAGPPGHAAGANACKSENEKPQNAHGNHGV